MKALVGWVLGVAAAWVGCVVLARCVWSVYRTWLYLPGR